MSDESIVTWKKLTAVDGIYYSKRDEGGAIFRGLVDAIDAQCDVKYDGRGIFPTIREMGEYVFGVGVTAYTLERTPYAWKGSKKP